MDARQWAEEHNDGALASWARRPIELSGYGLPYNSDGWDAYPMARQRILQAFLQGADNTLLLSDDSHSARANLVRKWKAKTNPTAAYLVGHH